jgi:hypothetical protein
MGSSSAPQPPTPGEAAQAAVGTAGAGEMMSIANQPVEQYANLYTSGQLGPNEIQTQQALANRAAYQGAVAQQDIQSRVDPMAYAQRQMRLQADTQRLARIYGNDPSQFTFRGPSAYQVPGVSGAPPLASLTQGGQAIAGNISTGSVNAGGGDPRLIPGSAQDLPTQPASQGYFV